MSVSVNAPKTPVTKGSNGIATATLPNICKMPGPPAPFVPAPLPNIGKSGDSPKGYSKKVKIEGKTVAIKGASFKSMGDMASKGTGGGLISANTHGPCKFISPGSMDVKFEGKNVHLLTDMVTNNGGPSGSPPNAATMMGTVQASGLVAYVVEEMCPICEDKHDPFEETDHGDGVGGTKNEAKALSDAFAKVYNQRCMIAVVHCKCDHKYARKSAKNLKKFLDVAVAYHCHKDTAAKILEKMQERFKGNNAFNHILAKTDYFYSIKNALTNVLKEIRKILGNDVKAKDVMSAKQAALVDLSRNPPGCCAAQGALVLAFEHDCTPIAMTEIWHAPKKEGEPAKSVHVRYKDKDGKIQKTDFKHGESVPPCETCNLLVPFLVCPKEQKPKCGTTVAHCERC